MATIIWLYLVFLTGLPPGTADGSYWKPVTTPDADGIPFLALPGNIAHLPGSTNSLLFTSDLEQWQKTSLPSGFECLRRYLFHANDAMWDLCLQTDYRTRVHRSTDLATWHAPLPEFNIAVRSHAVINDSTVLLGGDYGTLALVTPGEYTIMQAPSNRHTMAVSYLGNDIYMSFRQDGIYRLDKSSFEFTSMPFKDDGVSDIIIIGRFQNSEILAIGADGSVFQWRNGHFAPLPITFPDDIILFRTARFHHGRAYFIGMQYLWIFDGDELTASNLPTAESITGVFTGPDNKPVLQDEHGRLWIRETGLDFGLVEAPALLDLSFMPSAKNVRYLRTRLTKGQDLKHIFWDSERHNQVRIYRYEDDQLRDITSSLLPDPIGRIDQLYAFDFTGDGRSELLTVEIRPEATLFSLYLNVYGKLRKSHQWMIPSQEFDRFAQAAVRDMNNDGHPDLILSFYYRDGTNEGTVFWLENLRRSRFDPEHHHYITHASGWNSVFRIADLNADGNSDLLLGNYWRGDRIIYNFKNVDQNVIYDFPDRTNTFELLVADFTGSNIPDIVKVTLQNGLELWHNNHPQPGFTRIHDEALDQYFFDEIQALAATDLNGNGYNDLIISLFGPSTVEKKVLLNTGSGFYDAAEHIITDNVVNGTWTLWDYNDDGRTDIMVIRPAGTTILKNIGLSPARNGMIFTDNRHLIIHDNPAPSSWNAAIHRTLSRLNYLMYQQWIYWYLLMIVISYLFIFGGLRSGVKKFHWRADITVLLLTVNSILFWLLVVLLFESSEMIRLLLPLTVAATASFLPLFFSSKSRLVMAWHNHHHIRHELLEILLRFTHGAWAHSLINRLIMLFKNWRPEAGRHMLDQLEERLIHFRSSLLPEISRLTELIRLTDIPGELRTRFHENYHFFQKTDNDQLITNTEITLHRLKLLKEDISRLRHLIWKSFSCNLIDGVTEVVEVFKNGPSGKHVEWKIDTETGVHFIALVPHSVLTQTLDNLFTNAIRAMSQQQNPSIRIAIFRKAPKLYITVRDNGCGVDPDIRDRIFETGFSGFESSGLGLPVALRELAKYGARISIDNIDGKPGTIVTLEFLEGAE